jgi:hypothetical protein
MSLTIDAVITARRIFKRTYGNQGNFITPVVLEHGMLDAHKAYKLSTDNERQCWGVTVLEQHWGAPVQRRTDLGMCLHSEKEARAYIEKLKKGVI